MNENSILSEKIHKLLNRETANVDTYYNNESMWLIFTDSKKWVIELTKEGILWYNYYFFEKSFKFFNLDVVKNQHYITEWVESIIQNSVKKTYQHPYRTNIMVEEAIENGVKSTRARNHRPSRLVENTIQNGVKHTMSNPTKRTYPVDDTIQNGIKETNHVDIMKFFDNKMDNVLQNGIKETHDDVYHHNGRVEGVIKNGIKETNPHLLEIYNPMNFEPEIKEMKRMNEVNIVLEKGVKEVKELPDKSGELMGYGEYYARQKDRTYPHNDIVSNVISDGIKETNWRKVDNFPEYENRVIENGNLIKKD